MPSKQVTIQGVMTWEEGGPLGIWGGGNVPMPSPPIANVPGAPGYQPQPPGIWGPNDPRPTPPINLPPWYPGQPPGIWGGGNVPMPSPPIANAPGVPGYNPNPPGIWGPTDPRPGWGLPGTPPGVWGPPGPWPTPPIHLPPGWNPGGPDGPSVTPPAANVPIHGTLTWTEDRGWTFVPDGAKTSE